MTKMFEADRHNFGKCVERIERVSGNWYRKPRSIFWEHLFFGNRSPIKSFFTAVGPNGNRPIAEYLFNLNVEVTEEWLGYAEEVAADDIQISNDHVYSLGILIGYCYLLGIRDLHKYNLVVKRNHLQVIDAEVVLTNLILPNETLLLPFKEIPFEHSAVSLFSNDLKNLSTMQVEKIFAGYFDATTAVLDNLDPLTSTLENECLSNHRIRVILKNTRQYRDFLLGAGKADEFIPEELLQLERGDIPYFFKRPGGSSLYAFSSPDVLKPVAGPLPINLQRDVDRHSQRPSVLLANTNAVIRKIATGALYLQKVLAPATSVQVKDLRGLTLIKPSELSFRGHTFRSNTSAAT